MSANRTIVHSVSAIAVNQVAQAIGGALFLLLAPRLLQAEVYGQLAVAFALMTLWQMLGELGYQEVCSRFLPEMQQHHGLAAVHQLARRLLGLKVLVGLGLGLLAFGTAPLVLTALTLPQAALMGGAVVARVWAMGPFAVLLGLGRTWQWTFESGWRQIATVALLWLLVPTPNLTLALLALMLHEVLFCVLGFWWVRNIFFTAAHAEPPQVFSAFSARSAVKDFSQVLGFGLTFALANLALVALFRLAPIVVERFTGSATAAGFFDLALSGLMLLYTTLGLVAYAFVPLVTRLRLENQLAEADQWLARMVRYTTPLVTLAAGGMWAVAGPLVPLVFGPDFAPATPAIQVMALGLWPLPLAWACVTLTTVEQHPHRKALAAVVGLSVFVPLAWLWREGQAAGIAGAFALALAGYTLGFGHSLLKLWSLAGLTWLLATLTGLLCFVPLWLWPFPTLLPALALWAALAALYLGLLFTFHIWRWAEIRAFVKGIIE